MAVKVRKIDVNGHANGVAEYPGAKFVEVEDGVLIVRQAVKGVMGAKAIAVYRPGAWESAEVEVEDNEKVGESAQAEV